MSKRKLKNESEDKVIASKLLKADVLEETKEELPITETLVIGSTSSSNKEGHILKVEILEEKTKALPSTEAIVVASSSSSIDDDRYSFNYWKSSETEKSSQNEKENIKIENLIIGKIEYKALLIRITYKSEVKETKFGKVVSCLVMDSTGEIALVSFGKCALEIYKNWEFNQVYSIENFIVQEENSNYPSGSNNSLQLRANQNFMYKKMDQNQSPPIPFSFNLIHEIKTLKRNTRVDLIGILLKNYGLESNANKVPMRDLSITDNKKGMIIATLWGAAAEKFKSTENCVIAIRKGIVGEYQEKIKINCTTGTLVWPNPNIPEASPILKWFQCNKEN